MVLNSVEVPNLVRVEAKEVLEVSHMEWRQQEEMLSVLQPNLELNLSPEWAPKKLHPPPAVLHLDQPVSLVEWDKEPGNLVPTQQVPLDQVPVHLALVLVDSPLDQVVSTLPVWVVQRMTLTPTST